MARNELMNRDAEGMRIQIRDRSELDPPQKAMSYPRSGFGTSNRDFTKELTSIPGDSDSLRGEQKHCQPEQTPTTQMRRERRKRNTKQPETTIPPKLTQT
ncbi:hypothetical protein ACTXT7_017508 [Hymenolepis weldensis]